MDCCVIYFLRNYGMLKQSFSSYVMFKLDASHPVLLIRDSSVNVHKLNSMLLNIDGTPSGWSGRLYFTKMQDEKIW